ncbi:uncharacterized protein [Primulina huaijiensis]|uniref:uncharacterized protein n=1 Tax=Primulina huaijiensis TaxID=1492673 RepID=UPI003CC711F2
MAFAWISPNTFTAFSSASNDRNDLWKIPKLRAHPSSAGILNCSYKCESNSSDNGLKFVLHDALDSSGIDTTHARAAREGFCSQIQKLSDIERETSTRVNKDVDLGRAALHIAAEDDSLISHSSVPLPVDDFLFRLDSLAVEYCSRYSSSLRSSPEDFLECLNRYLYVNKAFRRSSARNQVEQRALYLNSVLTHRSGSVPMLSLIYSEILKMLRLWGVLNFDVEIFFPHDSYSSPSCYHKQESKESDQLYVMASQALLVEILQDLKHAFWPFQLDHARSLFLRAAYAAHCYNGSSENKESALELASAKAARHRLQRGVWTSVRFGDIRRALAACERLILLQIDRKELRDYAALLYHCGFYVESLQYLKLYQDKKESPTFDLKSRLASNLEEDEAVEKLIIRLNLILMEEGWCGQSDNRSALFNNTEPW